MPSAMIALGDCNCSPLNNSDGFLPLPKQSTVTGIGSLNKAQCYFYLFPKDNQTEAVRRVQQRHAPVLAPCHPTFSMKTALMLVFQQQEEDPAALSRACRVDFHQAYDTSRKSK